jgi:hypothetical protein
MISQISSTMSFPSYNALLGFWGAYATFTRHGKATFGLIAFSLLAIILDIVFCSINSSEDEIYRFAQAMLILCLILKAYLVYYACQFFGAIGGAAQIDPSILNSSRYSSSPSPLRNSSSGSGGYANAGLAMSNTVNGFGNQSTAGGYYSRESPSSSQLFEDNDDSSGLLR